MKLSDLKSYRTRLAWSVCSSVYHLIVILTITLTSTDGDSLYNLAALYLAFLLLDAAFQAINEIYSLKEGRLNFPSYFIVLLGVIASYFFVGRSFEFNAESAAVGVALCVSVTASRFVSTFALTVLNYQGRWTSILSLYGLTITLCLAALAFDRFVVSSSLTAVFQMLSIGLVSLLFLSANLNFAIRPRDLWMFSIVLLDFVKNQFTFIFYAASLASPVLASILLARSALSPVAQLVSIRRRTIEDKVVNGRSPVAGFWNIGTYVSYLLVLGLPAVVYAVTKIDFFVLFVWAIVLVLQDIRAHIIRMGVAVGGMNPQVPLFAGLVSIGISALVFFQVVDFSIALVLIPFAIDLAVLLLIRVAAVGRSG
jgi:hypothetical protein